MPNLEKQTIGKGKVLSKATVLGDLVFVSGIGPHDPKTGRQVVGGIREQTKMVMELMKAALEEAGSSLNNVLKCTVFLTDMNHYAEMNEVYSSYFTVAPARTCVQVSKLPRPEETVMIEIDAIACKAKKWPRMSSSMSIYDKLGVKRVINAWGTMTKLGGSLILPEATEAMDEAAKAFVDMDELHKQAGKIIAEITGAEAAYVTSGAAAALVLAVAACMTGDDPERMSQIPYTEGFKNEVIIPTVQDNEYVRNFAIPCAKLVKVGTKDGYTTEDVENAVTENTIAIGFVFFTSRPGCDMESLRKVVKIAKKNSIPVIVDAAAELPPIKNLRGIVATGADLVAFSGGKDVRGPSDSGFIVGRADLIKIIAAHGCPHHYIGRPMKVSKEQIVGLIVALQNYTPEAVKTRQELWEAMAEYFVKELSAEDMKIEKIVPNPERHEYSAQGWPRVRLTFDEGKLGTTAAEVNRLLRDGNPVIYAEQSGNRITLNPQCLQAGEERIIVNRLRKILKRQ